MFPTAIRRTRIQIRTIITQQGRHLKIIIAHTMALQLRVPHHLLIQQAIQQQQSNRKPWCHQDFQLIHIILIVVRNHWPQSCWWNLGFSIGNVSGTTSSTSGNANNNNFGLGIDEYGSSLYHPSATSTYPSYSPTGLLQTSYPVGSYNVSHPDHVRLYSSHFKHDFG